jgi:hypothetical protein
MCGFINAATCAPSKIFERGLGSQPASRRWTMRFKAEKSSGKLQEPTYIPTGKVVPTLSPALVPFAFHLSQTEPGLFPLPIYQSFPILPSHKRCNENARCLIPMPCRCGYISFPSSTFAGVAGLSETLKRVRGGAIPCPHSSFDCRGKWRQIPPAIPSDCSPSFFQRAVESVVENVAQREQAYEVAALIDDDEAVHA